MKISTKFSLLALFLVLFCGGLLFVLVNNETQELLEEEIRFKLERESRYATANTDRFIYERLNDIRNLAFDAVLSSDTASAKQILRRLNSFKKQNKLYVSVSFFNNDRFRIADTEEKAIGKQHTYSNYWLKTETEEVVLDISYSESLKEAVLHFAAVVRNSQGKKLGLVVSRVKISSLYEVFSEVIANENVQNLSVVLLDTTGLLLYSNKKQDSVLKQKYAKYDLLLQNIAQNKQVAKQQTSQDSSAVEVLHNYFEHDKQIFFYTFQQGYLNYEGHRWLFVMELPRKSAFASAKALRFKIYYTFVPVLLVSIVLSILFGRYVSKPIVQLSRVAKAWGSGHLQAKFELTTHKTDEIGELATQLQQMAVQLARRMNEQAELNNELQTTNETLQDLNLDLERKNQNITSSIHYAERIQAAMLPAKEWFKSVFPDSFIVFKPKQIVSGDFYWFQTVTIEAAAQETNQIIASEKKATTYLLVAAIDCTGHGVPGALMSMIGNNLLYQIVVHEQITAPDLVLLRLHIGVQKILNQGENNNKDGMDIAFCRIDTTRKQLDFAGVHRPLVLFQGGEMNEIKGTKATIGGNMQQENWAVQNHTLQIDTGDTLYLYSDGYGDQFQDADISKKFTGKRLKQLFQDIQVYDLEEQAQLLITTHRNWKGNLPQTDDILVLGVRFTENIWQ
jgi:serine phosphatase RsbU (regulator of sigma subunit)